MWAICSHFEPGWRMKVDQSSERTFFSALITRLSSVASSSKNMSRNCGELRSRRTLSTTPVSQIRARTLFQGSQVGFFGRMFRGPIQALGDAVAVADAPVVGRKHSHGNEGDRPIVVHLFA